MVQTSEFVRQQIEALKSEVFPNRPLKDISDTELDASSLKELVVRFKKLVHVTDGFDPGPPPRPISPEGAPPVQPLASNSRAAMFKNPAT